MLEEGKNHDEDEAKKAAQVGDDHIPIDNTPWMRKTRWARKFAKRDLLAVAARYRKPSKDEGSLGLVWQTVHRVLERCRASVSDWHDREEDGDVVLGWLNSCQVDKFNPDPFSIYYEKSTHAKYTNWWAHGICYCLRLVHAEDRHGHTFTAAEEDALRKVWDITELGCQDEVALDSSVFDLSVLLWTHEGRAHSKSSIIHFSAAFGIDHHKGCYRLPPVYGQILAALLYCARLIVFEYALPAAEREEIDNPYERFIQVHHQWLVDGRPTPFNYLNNLLAYALGAGKDVGGKPRVQWSKDRQVLIYQAQRLPLHQLRQFVLELCEIAESLLYNDLMFLSGSTTAYNIDLKELVDDMNESSVGYSFVSDPRNHLAGGRERMLERLGASGSSLLRRGEGRVEVRSEEWRKYRLQLQRFLATLFILVHMSNVPARGVEILSIRHSNAPQGLRDIFVHDGEVMIVTGYHKSQAITGQQKVIARFLGGRRISQLFVAFLADVLPFVTLLDRDHIPKPARCFVWADGKGIWNTPRATKALVEQTSTRLGCRITIQDYRHIAKAIDREHVRGLAADADDEGDDMHDLAGAHCTVTADGVYGIDASMLRSLTARTLHSFRAVSERWHQFWRVDVQRQNHGKLHGRALSQTAQLPDPKRRLVQPDPKDELELGLKRLIGPDATYRSVKQQEALIAIQKGTSPLVIVLPPAGGKSLLFQLPGSLSDAATTIVILPFRALTKDLVRRCRELGLRSNIWTGKQQCPAQIVFVSAETAAVNDDFLTFVSGLQAQGKLDRIVFDECQVPLTSASYRYHLSHVDRLRAIPCQLVLLTGTLPPLLQEALEDVFLLGTAEQGLQYIRASTNRRNVEYLVEVCCDDEVETRVSELIREARRQLSAGQRAVVFCRSRPACERMAEKLECRLYHRTLEAKEESLATWVDGSEKIMIATSALGTGVDIDGIRNVVHMGRPHGIMDFVQEVGRAGRSGEPVQSIIVLGKGEMKWMQSEAARESEWNREGLRLYLKEQKCRRLRLSATMDGEEVVCGEQGGRKCDLCGGVEKRKVELETARRGQSRAEEQERKYAVGAQLWQARVRQQAEQRQTIEWAVAEIGSQCAACWIHRRAERSHRPESCPVLEVIVGGEYWTKRRLIRFEADCFCCYHCSLPGDWCPWYSQGQKCVRTDVVTPIVFAGWAAEESRSILEKEIGGSGIDRLIKWIGKATLVAGTRASNGVWAAEIMIRNHRPASVSK